MKIKFWIILLIVIASVIGFYIYPKYHYCVSNFVLERQLKEARVKYEIEKSKADKEAEWANELKEAVRSMKMKDTLYPCYICNTRR